MAAETQTNETIVGYAKAHFSPLPARAGVSRGGKRDKTGIYVDGAEAYISPDGYVRRSPPQPVVTAADYHRRIMRKVIGVAVVCALLALAVYLLFHYKVISI